jgi:predicted acetyltransferase
MIARIESIEEIVPIFREYLGWMRRFYTIHNFDAWCDTALKNLQQYVKADGLIYSLKESDAVIGFAQVNQHLRFNNDGFAIAEFYIQKDHGKNGLGRRLAEYVFSRFSGNWEIAVAKNNTCALVFWEKVVSSYTSGKFLEKENASFDGYGFLFNNQ